MSCVDTCRGSVEELWKKQVRMRRTRSVEVRNRLEREGRRKQMGERRHPFRRLEADKGLSHVATLRERACRSTSPEARAHLAYPRRPRCLEQRE